MSCRNPIVALQTVLQQTSRKPLSVIHLHSRFVPSMACRAHGIRSYATQKADSRSQAEPSSPSSPSSGSTADLLRRLEAQSRQQGGTSGFGGQKTVGPFPLGVGASGRSRTWRKWNELGLRGKLWRSTQQAGNLSVILVGGGFLVLITLALTTELFAKNSPNVLYSQAVDRIRISDALAPHLLLPYSFTHSPHSSAPSRGSPPIAHAFARHPTSGKDHLLLTFWVHGRGIDEPESRSLGWIKSSWGIVKENVMWIVKSAGIVGPEEFDSPSEKQEIDNPTVASAAASTSRASGQSDGSWFGGWFGGMTLKSSGSSAGSSQSSKKRGLPPAGTYKLGEVRADYVKDETGQYELLSLIVDVPSSKAPYPGEAVIFWSPDATREGLQRRR